MMRLVVVVVIGGMGWDVTAVISTNVVVEVVVVVDFGHDQ